MEKIIMMIFKNNKYTKKQFLFMTYKYFKF